MKPLSLAVLLRRFLLSALALGAVLSASAQSTRKSSPLEIRVGTNLHLVLPKAALAREYLLSASLIPQENSPTSTGLAGKIVRFEAFHDGVDLYESTKGLVVTEDLPARRLLATFPVVERGADTLTIDFNKGMRRVFTDIWYGAGKACRPATSAWSPTSRNATRSGIS